MAEIVMAKRTAFRYVVHTIRVYGVNTVKEDEEKCSEELTALFADGWQKHDHQVKVKRTKVVHTWILTREEPEKVVMFEAPKPEVKEAPEEIEEEKEDEEPSIIFHVDDEPEQELSLFAQAMMAGKTVAEIIAIGNKEAYDKSMRVVRDRLIFSPVNNPLKGVA